VPEHHQHIEQAEQRVEARCGDMQIAEGGYSFVYLAHEVTSLAEDGDASSRQYAIKKVPSALLFS
jgi:hypothetical protein